MVYNHTDLINYVSALWLDVYCIFRIRMFSPLDCLTFCLTTFDFLIQQNQTEFFTHNSDTQIREWVSSLHHHLFHAYNPVLSTNELK